MDRERFSELLRYRRSQIDPADVGFDEPRYQRRKGAGLTQSEVARLMFLTERWYGKIERGDVRYLSERKLDDLSRVLRMSETERTMLYLYAVGHEPQRDDESCGDVPHEWQRLIDCIEFPAFLGDAAMNVIADNRAFRNFFGRLFGNETEFCGQRFNMIRWQLLSPELRGTQLVDWEKAWAERSSVHLRYLLGRYPENEDLKKIEHEVKQDPDASAIFVRAAHVFRSRTEDVRLLNIPERGVTPVTMSILRPITSGSVWLGIISPPADLAQDVASA